MSMPATAYTNFTEPAQVRNMELGLRWPRKIGQVAKVYSTA